LDLVDREALIRALAEEGIEGARALLRKAGSEDAALAQRIAELRAKLRRQASRQVGRVLGEYDQRAEALETVRIRNESALKDEMAALEARLKTAREIDLRRIVDPGLLGAVQDALLLPDASWNQPVRRTLWDRIKEFFARIAAFFRRLFGRKKAAAPVRAERSVTFATLGAGGRTLDPSLIGDAIGQLNPNEQEELRERVSEKIQRSENDLQKEAEAKRREAEAQRRRLEAEREEARRRAEQEVDRRVRDAEEQRVNQELAERGFVAERNGELAVTYGLVERFARLVLEDESRRLPGDVRRSLKGSGATGIYEKARLRQADEVAHLDIPSSVLEAHLHGTRHIDEDSSFVYREVLSERVHVVLAFDKSGSMEESGKLVAAKKALLALYTAIRRRYPDATIDVLAYDNDVHVLDLLQLWETPAGSFTNTGEAIHLAHLLLRPSRANRKEFFLVTDGLPESYTDAEGRVRSGNLDAAMENALARAQELRTIGPLQFTMILLRSEHPEYERAARLITKSLAGDLVITDPNRLGFELLVRWAGGRETARAPLPTADAGTPPAATPSPEGGARGRRRRADRRMGG
jgi:Mg-chelatase subunit ChlD